MAKIKASKGKILYCKDLKRYATATTDTKYVWVEIDEDEVKENEQISQ